MPGPARTATALVLCLLAAGCSGATTAAAPAETRTPAPSTSPTPSGAAVGLPDAPSAQPTKSYEPFTGPAAEEFGADAVMDAYLFTTEVVSAATFDGRVANLLKPTRADLSAVEEHLTPALLAEWVKDVEAIEAGSGDEDAVEGVFALSTFGIPGLVEGGEAVESPVRDAGFGGATASVGTVDLDGPPKKSLVLEFPVKGTFLLKDASSAVLVTTLTKDMTITLLETGDPARPWSIHAYEAARNVTEPEPAPAGLVSQPPAATG